MTHGSGLAAWGVLGPREEGMWEGISYRDAKQIKSFAIYILQFFAVYFLQHLLQLQQDIGLEFILRTTSPASSSNMEIA